MVNELIMTEKSDVKPDTEEEILRHLEVNRSGEPVNSLANSIYALTYDPQLRGAVRYNEFTEKIDVMDTVNWTRTSPPMTDSDLVRIRLILEKNYKLKNEKTIESAILYVADEHRYHPVRDYLESLEWDGTERVSNALFHFFGVEKNQYTMECLKVFMLAAVSRVYEPGRKFDVMLCLTGGQGAGKSTFFRFLATKDAWFTDDVKNLSDAKIYERLQGHWIIEMSEMLATSNAGSVEEIKAFISRLSDIYRTPWHHFGKDRLRQCVFGGTTNRKDFLPNDRSGNRRFFPVQVNEKQAETHILTNETESRAYIEQMWAEIMVIFRSGNFSLELSAEADRILSAIKGEFMQEDSTADQIYGWFDSTTTSRVCSKMIYFDVLHNMNDPKNYELRNINEIVNSGIAAGRITGWRHFSSPQRFHDYGTQKGWERIPAVDKSVNEDVNLSDISPAVYDRNSLTVMDDSAQIPFD